jgi:hypothetical protein
MRTLTFPYRIIPLNNWHPQPRAASRRTNKEADLQGVSTATTWCTPAGESAVSVHSAEELASPERLRRTNKEQWIYRGLVPQRHGARRGASVPIHSAEVLAKRSVLSPNLRRVMTNSVRRARPKSSHAALSVRSAIPLIELSACCSRLPKGSD